MLRPTQQNNKGNSQKSSPGQLSSSQAKLCAAQHAIAQHLSNQPVFGSRENNKQWLASLQSHVRPFYPKKPDVVAELAYLPIETFKYQAESLFPAQTAVQFLSSGTTSQDRSTSAFSELGLWSYLFQAREAFIAVLSHFFESPKTIPGLSLIPPLAEWPDSSLAHMLDDLSKSLPLSYVERAEVLQNLNRPHWIFGTAFHYINLFDQGFRCKLPEGSIIFETGGSKGRSRELGRDELYELLSAMFGVDRSAIISEYGMSELSCQAYDFARDPARDNFASNMRFFRFPHWVDVKVLDQSNVLQTSGYGSLVVQDPLRIDAPWPIRTQDLVTLDLEGRILLHGRVPSASLKGCSLRVSELLGSPTDSVAQVQTPQFKSICYDTLLKRSLTHFKKLKSEFESARCFELFLEYFENSRLAQWAQEDILNSLPKDSNELARAAQAAIEGRHVIDRWLLIGPQTHPLAIFHPLIMASILDIQMTVRLSSRGHAIEKWLVEILRECHARIELLDSSFRLTGSFKTADAIMVYGEDQTLHTINKLTGQIVQGFGSSLSIGFAEINEFDDKLALAVIRDAFSLKQQGCRSLRALVIMNSENAPKIFAQQIQDTLQILERVWLTSKIQLNEKEIIAQQHDLIRMRQVATKIVSDKNPQFPVFTWKKDFGLEDYLSPCPFRLPLVSAPDLNWQQVSDWLAKLPHIKICGLSENAEKYFLGSQGVKPQLHKLGAAQSLAWNGWHDGVRLFANDGTKNFQVNLRSE